MRLLLVLPTHNEELIIESTLRTVLTFLKEKFASDDWHLLVADNGSTDRTQKIVERVCHEWPRLSLQRDARAGRGRALRQAWLSQSADVYAYMDADLASELADLPRLLLSLKSADLAVGSRLIPGAVVTRSSKRELLSRLYSHLARALLPVKTHDLQCGFKAIRHEAARALLPTVEHNGWFFDTELIARAASGGWRVSEVPIHWQETRDKRRKSTVRIFTTIIDDLYSLWRLRARL